MHRVLGYEEEMSRGIFVLRETDEGYYDIPLYSRFKQVEYKGVPPPLSGDYTPRAQEDIDDSGLKHGVPPIKRLFKVTMLDPSLEFIGSWGMSGDLGLPIVVRPLQSSALNDDHSL
ncbi:hypothetical protein Tco_1056782 [Tanacetum coccineum]|uniref:Uncharacterized protein n=1 Tax=Tanacetum coccineum TaxID=301880 RepID=A0ABQ5H4Y9_9ASTR